MENSKLNRIPAEIELCTLSNDAFPVSKLYQNSPIILFCLRSVNCFMCKRMTKLITDHIPMFKKFNVTVYCIIKEDFNAQMFIDEHWFDPSTLLVNPNLELFKLFGNGELRQMDFFNTKIWQSAYQSLNEGFRWSGGLFSQNTVLGGTLLVSQQGEIVFESLEFIAGDLPDIQGLLAACEGLYFQDEGEERYKEAFSPGNLLSMGIDFSKVESH